MAQFLRLSQNVYVNVERIASVIVVEKWDDARDDPTKESKGVYWEWRVLNDSGGTIIATRKDDEIAVIKKLIDPDGPMPVQEATVGNARSDKARAAAAAAEASARDANVHRKR